MLRTISFLIATTLVLCAEPAAAEVFYEVDFERGDTAASVGTSNREEQGGSIEAVPNPAPSMVNDSALVGRFRVQSSASKVRAELSSQRMVTDGQTYRYRWSYYVPRASVTGVTLDWFVVSQWKTWPCEVCNATYDPAICGGCGGIFDEARIVDDQWEFRWRAEPDCHEYQAPVPYDRWVRFEMLVYWTKGSNGYVRLWQDGALVQSMDGIRTLFTSFESGTCDMYWAVGFYSRWSGSKDHLELFVDDIQISDETAPPEVTGTAGAPSTGGNAGSDTRGGAGNQSPSGGGNQSPSGGGNQSPSGGQNSGAGTSAANPSGSKSDGGCGCRMVGTTTAGAWLGLLLVAAGALLRSRPVDRQRAMARSRSGSPRFPAQTAPRPVRARSSRCSAPASGSHPVGVLVAFFQSGS